MLVCHCKNVSDREIRRCVREGADSAAAVRDACGAGGGCGGCVPLVERLVRAETAAAAPIVGLAVVPALAGALGE